MKKIILIDGSSVSPFEAKRIADEKMEELELADYEATIERFGYIEDDYEGCTSDEYAYWTDVWNEADAEIKNATYIIGYDCLLEGVFVPNMEDRMQEKSMQQRLRDEEPDVFDTDVSAEQMREWIYC